MTLSFGDDAEHASHLTRHGNPPPPHPRTTFVTQGHIEGKPRIITHVYQTLPSLLEPDTIYAEKSGHPASTLRLIHLLSLSPSLLLNRVDILGMQFLHSGDDEALNLQLGLAFGQTLRVDGLVLSVVCHCSSTFTPVFTERHTNPVIGASGRDENLFLLISAKVRGIWKHTTSHLRVDLDHPS